jgi:hypothetical protein
MKNKYKICLIPDFSGVGKTLLNFIRDYSRGIIAQKKECADYPAEIITSFTN